jgi:hypothetical protein
MLAPLPKAMQQVLMHLGRSSLDDQQGYPSCWTFLTLRSKVDNSTWHHSWYSVPTKLFVHPCDMFLVVTGIKTPNLEQQDHYFTFCHSICLNQVSGGYWDVFNQWNADNADNAGRAADNDRTLLSLKSKVWQLRPVWNVNPREVSRHHCSTVCRWQQGVSHIWMKASQEQTLNFLCY